ncbi:membrane protein YczE [Mycobacterium sp. MMS18-G62]
MRRAALQGAALLIGLSGYGFSMAVMVRAGLGLDPWDVFHQGLTMHTPMTIGVASAVVGVAVLLAWIPLRNRPGVGTVANVIVIAVTVDAALWMLPAPTSLGVRIAMMVGAVVFNAFSTVLYVGAGLGPGPRDGLMTGLVVRTGWSVRVVRTSIEATVLAVGWLLGGTVGVGTVLYAFGIGPLVQLFLRITPNRVLAVSGWSSVAEASDLGARTGARRVGARRNRVTTMVECQSPEKTQPTPTC